MLLTITTTHTPATDLGYLLHKHPDKYQVFNINYGQVEVFYPEVDEQRCTAALLLNINPIELLRSKKSSHDFLLKQYVNDRPYVASSLMSVAISRVFSTAMAGKCEARPQLVSSRLPLEAKIAVMAARGERILQRLFEPLGYEVVAKRLPVDEKFPEWGDSDYFIVTLRHEICLKELLSHLYVLIPVLDDDKHYWAGPNEVEKLLDKAGPWLSAHPERDLIVSRYLKHDKYLVNQLFEQLIGEEADMDSDQDESVHQQRLQQVVRELQLCGAKTVLDLGCGRGLLLELLLREKNFSKIVGVDVSHRELGLAKRNLYFDDMAPKQRERIDLIHGSLTYRDKRLYGFDAAAIVEVIEHLDQPRLKAFERVVFEFMQPSTVILTTPNREYNVVLGNAPDEMRHSDHRFEWTRREFREWAEGIAARYGYTVRFASVGEEHEQYGALGQMAVFSSKW